MRANAGYGLTYVGEEFRHTFRAELDYRPLRHWKGKRKLDLAARTLFQYVGNPDGGVDERSPTVVRRQGWRPDWLGQSGHHRVTLSE